MTQPIPATKLLASHYRSGRGACGFVLVVQPDLTKNGASSVWRGLTNAPKSYVRSVVGKIDANREQPDAYGE